MILIILLKILFYILAIREAIAIVSRYYNSGAKKARVFHGNCRMPKDVLFALMYGLKTKTKFPSKDLSYKKSLAQWWQLINANYPVENKLMPERTIPVRLENILSGYSDLKSPSGDLGVNNGNRKPFPKLKTGNTNFIPHSKTFVKNNSVISPTLFNTKIADLKILKMAETLYQVANDLLHAPQKTLRFNYFLFLINFIYY
jgi:hypothetical protein